MEGILGAEVVKMSMALAMPAAYIFREGEDSPRSPAKQHHVLPEEIENYSLVLHLLRVPDARIQSEILRIRQAGA